MSGTVGHGPSGHGGASAAAAPPRPRLDVELELVAGRARLGCKGPAAEAWLRGAGVELPAAANTFLGDGGLLVARLGTSEFFIEAAAGEPVLATLAAGLAAAPAGVYPVLREDWTLALAGADVHELLVQVCNVYFAALAPASRQLVMTLMIGVAVLVVPRSAGGVPAYTIWCDPSYGAYLGATLGSLVIEYGGTFKGEAA